MRTQQMIEADFNELKAPTLWQRIVTFCKVLWMAIKLSIIIFLIGSVINTSTQIYFTFNPLPQKKVITPYDWSTLEIQRQATRLAREYCIREDIFLALIQKESSYRIGARSPVGAKGLCQLMDATFEECIKELKIMEPNAKYCIYRSDLNLRCGAYYLSKQVKRFGYYDQALAAYNAGAGGMHYNVAKQYAFDILRACGIVSGYMALKGE